MSRRRGQRIHRTFAGARPHGEQRPPSTPGTPRAGRHACASAPSASGSTIAASSPMTTSTPARAGELDGDPLERFRGDRAARRRAGRAVAPPSAVRASRWSSPLSAIDAVRPAPRAGRAFQSSAGWLSMTRMSRMSVAELSARPSGRGRRSRAAREARPRVSHQPLTAACSGSRRTVCGTATPSTCRSACDEPLRRRRRTLIHSSAPPSAGRAARRLDRDGARPSLRPLRVASTG